MNQIQQSDNAIDTLLSTRSKALLKKLEAERQLRHLETNYEENLPYDSKQEAQQLQDELEQASKELATANQDIRKFVESNDQSQIPSTVESHHLLALKELGISLEQYDMVWFAEDPTGDTRIYFCDPDLDDPDLGLIVLDHRNHVSARHNPHSKSEMDINQQFKHYLDFQICCDPRQIWTPDKFDRMLTAQYNQFTKPSFKKLNSEPEAPLEESIQLNLIDTAKRNFRSLWEPITK